MKLGEYEIKSSIGAGGMGEVFRAHDARLDREVAIKVLSPSFASDPERLRRFEQEARVVASLSHANILAIYGLGTHEGSPYIVTELLEGDTLRGELQQKLPIRKAMDYAVQIARGLAAAHEKGIIHRDLKPENIFVTREGHVKILDFGLAKLVPTGSLIDSSVKTADAQPGTSPGQVLGTVGYMSPEQVRGLVADHRSDIFSFGAILFEMFSGQRAFKRDSAVETMSAILKEEPPELDLQQHRIPLVLDRIIRHCLEKKPEQRFQSARDIAFDLEALRLDSTTTAQKALSAKRTSSWLLPALSVIALLATAMGGWWLGRSRNPEPPSFRLLTFRRGVVRAARFAPDGHSILYAAAWEGQPSALYASNVDSPGERQIAGGMFPLSVSKSGELAVLLRAQGPAFASRGVLARMPLSGGEPREIMENVGDAAWAQDGSLAVIHFIPATNSYQLEFPIGHVLAKSSGWMAEPRFSPDGKRIGYMEHPLANGDDRGQPAVVDLAGKGQKLAHEYSSAQGLVWSPDGKELWYTASDRGTDKALYAVTMADRVRLLSRVPGDVQVQDISSTGELLLVHDEKRHEMRGRGPGDKEEHDLSWMDFGVAADITPDGNFFLFDEEGAGGGPDYSVFMRKTDGSPAIKLTSFGNALAISPDGKMAIVSSNDVPQKLYIVPTGAGEPEQIMHARRDFISAFFNGDGSVLLYNARDASGPPRLYALRMKDRMEFPVTPVGMAGRAHTIDGLKIITCGGGHCYFCPTDGSCADKTADQMVAIPGELGKTAFPLHLLPDGRNALVSVRAPGKIKVHTYDLEKGTFKPFQEFGPPDLTGVSGIDPLRFTPDGKSYIYSYLRRSSQLYAVSGVK